MSLKPVRRPELNSTTIIQRFLPLVHTRYLQHWPLKQEVTVNAAPTAAATTCFTTFFSPKQSFFSTPFARIKGSNVSEVSPPVTTPCCKNSFSTYVIFIKRNRPATWFNFQGNPKRRRHVKAGFFKKRQHCIHLLGMDANSNTCKSPLSFKCSVDIIANTSVSLLFCVLYFYYLRIKKTLTITWDALFCII